MPAVSFKTFVQGSTAATTPLGGTEQIVIIQGNAVVQCVADDLGGGGGGTTVVNKTVAEMQALALASGFTAGQLYKITDAGDLGLFFRAATTSKLENDGIRVMLCPAYYGTGENNGDGNNWLGVWNANLTPAPGDLVIWGGTVWANNNGNIGSAESDTDLDGEWIHISKASFTAGEYTPLIFGCSYDLANNWISRQWDAAGNVFGIDYFTEQNWWAFGFNPCDVSDWNLATRGQNFFNNICIGVWNNSNTGSIIGNIIADGAIGDNSNAGDIYCNSNARSIVSNSNTGDIYACYGQGDISYQTGGAIFGEVAKPILAQPGDANLGANTNGVTFTDTGSAGTVRFDFEDVHPIGIEFSFFVTDNGIELNPGAASQTIQFWDGSVSRNTPLVLLGAPGKSITIKKISATVWAGIAVNGAVDND